MLFPVLSPQYLDEADRAILAKMETFYAESITINQSFWSEADTDTRFEIGDQSLWNDLYGNLPANRRRQFSFNRIRRCIENVYGYQRRNRKSTVCIPIENSDAKTADQFTKILMSTDKTEGVLETISESFHGALVTGMNLLHVWMDYREDPVSGTIKVDNCSYNSFLVDPYFRKSDLSDCNSIWKRSFLTKRECLSLFPNKEEEIMGLIGGDNGTGRDFKFQYMPESYNYGYKSLLTYDEFYYRDFRSQKMLVDSNTGETMEWTGEDDDLDLFLQIHPEITTIDNQIPTVKLAIVIQGKVFYNGPQPSGLDTYPFIAVLGYFNPQSPYFPWRIQGMVRGLRDAQYLYNRRRIIELDILESQINSGWKFKENSLVNPSDAYTNTGQGKPLIVKQEAQMSDVEKILPGDIPPSMIQLSELLAKEVMEISGVNEELLGSSHDDKAGVLSMLRQGAGLTTLQSLFDQLDRSQKLLGNIMIKLIQANYTPGKVQKILEGQQPSAQFYNKAFGKYHAMVEEGLNTTNQRQMALVQLLQLKEIGVPIPNSVLLEQVTIQEKDKLMESINQQEQQASQMQQMQLDLQMEEIKSRINLSEARAIADRGLGLERASRVDENEALAEERRAAAVKDEDIALLNLVKAIKEMEGIDIDNIQKLVAMSSIIEQQKANNNAESQQQKQGV